MQKTIPLFFLAAIAITQLMAQPNIAKITKKPAAVSTPTTDNYFAHCDEIAASFPDGPNGWRIYMEKHLNYPDSAIAKMTQGIVRVQLTIEVDGSVTDVKALNNPGDGLAEEAVRVIKSSPKWIPAKMNGKPVQYRFTQNITFGPL